jgi:hypothetical protein
VKPQTPFQRSFFQQGHFQGGKLWARKFQVVVPVNVGAVNLPNGQKEGFQIAIAFQAVTKVFKDDNGPKISVRVQKFATYRQS